MVSWEAVLLFLATLLGAALAGWLPFVLLERLSMVDQLDVRRASVGRSVADSRAVCPACGRVNDPGYDYCGRCGGKILTDES